MPTGAVALVAALWGSTMMAVACPSRKSRSGLLWALSITTVKRSLAVTLSCVNRALSLLVLVLLAARAKLNCTLSAVSGWPL